jgi:phytanoyl-CoA hydroxylase
MTALDSDQIFEDFERDGFAIIRNVIDGELLAEADEHVKWLVGRYPDLRPEHFHHPLMRDDAFWVRMVTDPRLVEIARLFLGDDIGCFTAHYVCKPALSGHPVLWHQDGAYWKLDPMDALTVWLAVDASMPKNGCLKMVPGSHRIALDGTELRTDVDNMLYSQARAALVEQWVARAGVVDIVLNPGDVSIHHPHILHCSEANRSSSRRCGLDIGYMRATTRISNDGLYLDPLLVHGSPQPGVNTYRAYPRYVQGETIPFAGHDLWNASVDERNTTFGFKPARASDERPIDITRRMVQRLRRGTVKHLEGG